VGKFFVTEITFRNCAADIYYARIPDPGDLPVAPSYLLAAPADRTAPHQHFTPVEVRPAAGSPHWHKQAGNTIAPDLSWPAAYTRTGAAGAPPAPQLRASFEIVPHIPGDIDTRISATSAAGVGADILAVTIQNGVAANRDFTISGLPGTIARFDGMDLRWNYLEPAHITKHTIFVVDETPKPANNGYGNQYLWEVLEWSCHWANGVTGPQPAIDAIWGHFDPVQVPPVHETGLTYWKNQHTGAVSAQNLADAIRSKDGAANVSGGATCIVFDRIFINCLTVQGIDAAEVKVRPDNSNAAFYNNVLVAGFAGYGANPPGPFDVFTDRLGRDVYAYAWVDTTIVGQANTNSPALWQSHWIAAVNTPAGWMFYDACYGEGAIACVAAPGGVGSVIDVDPYEPYTAAFFYGREVTVAGAAVTGAVGYVDDIPLSTAVDELPCLFATILWRSF
jgi:hypothetical protein